MTLHNTSERLSWETGKEKIQTHKPFPIKPIPAGLSAGDGVPGANSNLMTTSES